METIFKKHKLVMLPTEKAENCLIKQSNKLSFHKGYLTQDYLKNSLNASSFHLYVLSDEEIKEGDYCYDKVLNAIFKIDKYADFKYVNQTDFLLKIIATTDWSLSPKIHKGETVDESYPKEFINGILPEIPTSFIKHYISEYNKGNIIDEINVEYEEVYKNGKESVQSPNLTNWSHTSYVLKINSKSEINTSILKDSYTKEEVEQKLRNAFDLGRIWGETYQGWFIPTQEEHEKKINEMLFKNL